MERGRDQVPSPPHRARVYRTADVRTSTRVADKRLTLPSLYTLRILASACMDKSERAKAPQAVAFLNSAAPAKANYCKFYAP